MPYPILIPSMLVTVDSHVSTSSDSPPSYATYPEEGRVVSSYSDWSSYSSRESSPPSPGPKTLLDKDLCAPSTLGGKPIHIDFIDRRSDIIMKHDKILINVQNEQDTFTPFLFRSSSIRPTINW